MRSGWSAVETLVTLALVALVATSSAADLVLWRQRARLEGTTRRLGLTLAALRARAATAGQAHGLWVRVQGEDLHWLVVADGNGNGLRTAELLSEVDLVLDTAAQLGIEAPGIRAGLPAGVTGINGSAVAALTFGGTELLSVGPDGTSSSGTLYLSDAHGNAAALRMYGPTGRISLWRRRESEGRWMRFR